MSRHRFDPLSFVFGVVFAVIAAAGFTGPWDLRPVDLAWAGPGLLILLGVALLVSGRQVGDEQAVGPAHEHAGAPAHERVAVPAASDAVADTPAGDEGTGAGTDDDGARLPDAGEDPAD